MSNLSLDRLLFDPADYAAGPSIGSYIIGADGSVATISDEGGKKGLDVNVINEISAVVSGAVTVSGSVDAVQSGTWIVSAEQSGAWVVNVNEAGNTNYTGQPISVDNTVGGIALPTSPLAGRRELIIQNVGDKPIYIGESGVTTSSGIKVDKGSTLVLEVGPSIAIYGITAAGSCDIRIAEIA